MLWLLMDLILVGFRGLKGYKSELSAFQLTNILTAKLIRKHFTKTNFCFAFKIFLMGLFVSKDLDGRWSAMILLYLTRF